MPKVVKQLSLNGVVQEQKLLQAWPQVVGERIARHTQALSVNRRILVVAVDSPGWMMQLTFLKPELLRKLAPRAKKDELRDIRFVLGGGRPTY